MRHGIKAVRFARDSLEAYTAGRHTEFPGRAFLLIISFLHPFSGSALPSPPLSCFLFLFSYSGDVS
jgi:hypothetical protein